MFRIAITALAATLALSSTSTAQEAFDWTGVYGGLSYTMNYEPESTGSFGGTDTTDESNALGFFGGYVHQFDQYVVGMEVHSTAYSGSGVAFPADLFGSIFEARLRGGYAFDRVLVSAFGGYASQRYEDTAGGAQILMTGTTYGVGVDFALPNNLVLGAEYVVRDLSGADDLPAFSLDSTDETFRIRFGLRF